MYKIKFVKLDAIIINKCLSLQEYMLNLKVNWNFFSILLYSLVKELSWFTLFWLYSHFPLAQWRVSIACNFFFGINNLEAIRYLIGWSWVNGTISGSLWWFFFFVFWWQGASFSFFFFLFFPLIPSLIVDWYFYL